MSAQPVVPAFSLCYRPSPSFHFFFFNDTATTEIYTLSLHDALPISDRRADGQQENHQQLCAKTHGFAPVAAPLEGPGAPAAADSSRSSQTSSSRHAPQRRGIQSRTAAPSPTVSGT